jgi:hypothetical protein
LCQHPFALGESRNFVTKSAGLIDGRRYLGGQLGKTRA